MNGSSGWKKADLKPLKGRNLLLWPDNDDAGLKAMQELASYLVDQCASVKILDVSELAPKSDAACTTWPFSHI